MYTVARVQWSDFGCRKRMWTCSWSTPVTCTTVSFDDMRRGRARLDSLLPRVSGTGLSDGYPAGGVDAHEVRADTPTHGALK